MKQIIVKNMTLSDLMKNIFYKFRYWSYRNFFPKKLINFSSLEKRGRDITFNDDFDEVSWIGKEAKWGNQLSWGSYHPDNLHQHYGVPELIEGKSMAKFMAKYKPRTFTINDEKVSIPFEVSKITTKYTHRQQFGRFECRCTIPFDNATWGAFWLWGST